MENSPFISSGTKTLSKYLKLTLILGGVGLIGGFFLWPYLKELDLSAHKPEALKTAEAIRVNPKEILNPRYTSLDEHNRPYVIQAKFASYEKDNQISLNVVSAALTLEGGALASLTSHKAMIVPGKTGMADLVGDVNFIHENGYEIMTDEAHIDFEKGIVTSHHPVEGKGVYGFLKGEGVKIDNKTKHVELLGKSKITLFPDAQVLPLHEDF
jgi:hypothetical protein